MSGDDRQNSPSISRQNRPSATTILDAECNMVVDVTSDYIASLLIGHSLYTELEIMVKELQEKYNGISLKALIVALRDAHSKTKDRGALPDGMTV